MKNLINMVIYVFKKNIRNALDTLMPIVVLIIFVGSIMATGMFLTSKCNYKNPEAAADGAFGILMISTGIVLLVFQAIYVIIRFCVKKNKRNDL